MIHQPTDDLIIVILWFRAGAAPKAPPKAKAKVQPAGDLHGQHSQTLWLFNVAMV